MTRDFKDVLLLASKKFDYDPSTGTFISKKSGEISGSMEQLGYLSVAVGRTRIKSHRLAWLFAYGRWPNGEIDHINGNRADNRIANLREVTRSQNMQNLHKVRGASIYHGVTWNERLGKWRARITVDKKRISLGCFDKEELAYAAYIKAKKIHHIHATKE